MASFRGLSLAPQGWEVKKWSHKKPMSKPMEKTHSESVGRMDICRTDGQNLSDGRTKSVGRTDTFKPP